MAGTILVVDDERNIVQLARIYLEKEGFQVESAATGREALAKVQSTRPDLIVLDLMLPELDGWEVCRRLRKDSNLPIIMVTARDDDVDKIVGLELGADDYLTKPFNPRELIARVKALLRRAAASQAPARVLRFLDLEVDLDRREARLGRLDRAPTSSDDPRRRGARRGPLRSPDPRSGPRRSCPAGRGLQSNGP